MEMETLHLADGAPELSVLGKRIELLRIERGLSKQALARRAGTSRQQLWRVMTGKSELTGSLCLRLAEVLQADPRALRDPNVVVQPLTIVDATSHSTPPATFGAWLREPEHLIRTLATLPTDGVGRALRLSVIDAVERRARELSVALPTHVVDMRRRLVTGEV